LRHRRRKVWDCGGRPSSVAFGILEIGSGRKPLLQKDRCRFGRSGFSRDPCATDDGRLGIGGGGFIRGLWDLEGRSRGESPSYQKIDVVLVGAASAATLTSSKTEGSGWGEAAFIRGLGDLEGRFGAEAPSARRLGPWIDGFFPKRGRIDAV
jgi:hypothetical protein